ncbi:hypothetical protein EUTSA_v10029416mg [Eutrema salsugineum]|uniref:F-box domain-containing protein n=1 Tax=Eutrema salsugineum TaxID=72664 RepID=V4L3S7_EUTSA|nr:putative F-box/kelch-repeat protein At4g11770 [Eutrema salsugineum]ESQ38309.1 hypothetical protein EUTSA_v10029416mg [Eutrema salsugineum]
MSNGKESYSPVNMLNLPDEILLNCLSRVSRLYYQTLFLVSKRFRSLIASLELYETRTLLDRTENCLYLCLSFSFGSDPRWFTLCRRPTRNPNPKTNSGWFTPCFKPYKKSSDKLMVSVQTHDCSPPLAWSRTAIGSKIYVIGTKRDHRVFFMDCRSHAWHEAPSMQIFRKWETVSVLDRKIYVVEGWTGPGYSDLMEVFDPKTQIWEHVPSPRAEILNQSLILRSLALDGKLYVYGSDKTMVYKPNENTWDVVENSETRPLIIGTFFPSCVIDNVMYCSVMLRVLQWYDSEGRLWRVFKGLEELPKLPKCRSRVKLVDYGGKIAVLWEKRASAIGFDKKIWCAVIAVDRRSDHEVYGKIEWCDVVLTVPRSCRLLQFLAVNV